MEKNEQIIKGFKCLNIAMLMTVVAAGCFCLFNLL